MTDLPTVDVDSVKTALRIDTTADDEMIQSYINTAKDYVAKAVDSKKTIEDFMKLNRFRLAVLLLVQFWYSNRNTDMKQTPYQVVSLIQQLRSEN
ncbi:head-tail connector protein [Limosilactobacillus sp.]|uniref:head-tail connector protein n=1 Tax=Limosilactobacillus sp. TaxID=2773925 RepID=UPI00345ED033